MYFISDQHYGHANILKFVSSWREDGVRPEFNSVEEMDEAMVSLHNATVAPSDKIYFLGDIAFGKGSLERILPRLNGKKSLILGNHDPFKKEQFDVLFQHFDTIRESRTFGNIVFTHRPVLLGSHEIHIKLNVHGHIHENRIYDPRYLNISVEQIKYTPIHYETIVSTFEERGLEVIR